MRKVDAWVIRKEVLWTDILEINIVLDLYLIGEELCLFPRGVASFAGLLGQSSVVLSRS
jgi:hypothetical protein